MRVCPVLNPEPRQVWQGRRCVAVACGQPDSGGEHTVWDHQVMASATL